MNGPVGGQCHIHAVIEDEVLCELNADFHRSKVELIHRFLSDQQELNKRFAEYALNSDEDGSESEEYDAESGNCPNLLSRQQKPIPTTLTEEDILQDLECRSTLDDDNLSTTSAIHSSTGGESDIGILDEERAQDRSYESFTEYSMGFRDQNGNISDKVDRLLSSKPASRGPQFHSDLSPPGSGKRNSNSSSRKAKKVLVKKNVRPQTAAGFRRATNMEEETQIIQQRLEDERSRSRASVSRPEPKINQHTPQISQPAVRMKNTSWLQVQQGTENVSQRLAGGGCTNKEYQQPTAIMSQGESRLTGFGPIQNLKYETRPLRVSQSFHIIQSTKQSPVRKSRSLMNNTNIGQGGGLLSIDINPSKKSLDTRDLMASGCTTPVPTRDFFDGRASVCSNISGKHSAGRRTLTNPVPHNEVMSTGKRQITVVKLPPLEGAIVVNKSIMDQSHLVSGATKGNVTPATEFMAG